MRAFAVTVLVTVCTLFGAPSDAAEPPSDDRSFREIVGPLEHRAGLLDLWIDPETGRVWLGLPAPGENGEVGTYLYVEGLLTGLGSNPVGLDRGQLGEGRIVTFRAAGGKVLLEEQNLRFRADDAHPLDARYHVIQWVHRSTRGWSYGGGVLDPRTGEIVKAYVTLGSLRVRQDRLLFEGLLGVEETGTGSPRDPVELALARIRQLAAHEVGHALGLAHNFAASTYGRASVMDYPAPWVRLADDGSLDVSKAYGVGVQAWDVQAIRYGYREIPPGRAGEEALDALVREGIERSLRFVSDEHSRPPSAAHPLGNLWDNGSDPVAELGEVMRVRRLALDRFGPRNLAEGRPLARLQEVLAPVYLYHRYQTAAAAKSLGGVDFRYAVRGDDQPPVRPVPADEQRRALSTVLTTLEPAELDLPDEVLQWILPRPPGHPPNRELFEGRMDPVFDPLAAAASAAEITVGLILEPHRAARLVDQHRRDRSLPGFTEVLDALVATTFEGEEPPSRRAEIRHAVQAVVVAKLVELAGFPDASPAVRARAEAALRGLADRLDAPQEPHARFLAGEIERYFARPGPTAPGPPPAPEPPPGSPIGG